MIIIIKENIREGDSIINKINLINFKILLIENNSYCRKKSYILKLILKFEMRLLKFLKKRLKNAIFIF